MIRNALPKGLPIREWADDVFVSHVFRPCLDVVALCSKCRAPTCSCRVLQCMVECVHGVNSRAEMCNLHNVSKRDKGRESMHRKASDVGPVLTQFRRAHWQPHSRTPSPTRGVDRPAITTDLPEIDYSES